MLKKGLMDRKKAISYLQSKSKIRDTEKVVDLEKLQFSKKEEAQIQKVMAEGYIYDEKRRGRVFGDPLVILEGN